MTPRLLALLSALALLLGACGGSSSDDASPETTADTATTTTTTAETTTTTSVEGGGDAVASGEQVRFGDLALQHQGEESARFEGLLTIVGSEQAGMAEPVEIVMSGATDVPNDASRVSIDMSRIAEAALAGGGEVPPGFEGLFDEPLEVITIGDTSYMSWSLLAMMTGVDSEWVQLPPDDTGALTSGLGLGSAATSPTAFLDQLADAESEVEVLGEETIRGEATTHYRVLVDVAALGEELSAEERTKLEQDLGSLDEPLPIELWIGEDGRLHRYGFELTGGQDPQVESVGVLIDVFDHGADVAITAPPADQVTPLEGLGAGPGSGG